MIGEGVAARMAQQHNSSTQGYFYVKGPEFLNMYVGETERGIRNCFEEADKHYEKTGFPATLVFDECESLLSRRGSSNGVDMEKTVVPTFLSLMNETTALVILMTNRADTLDPAVIRDGRFDRQIFIGRPTRDSAEIIIRKNLSRYPLDKGGAEVETLARIVTDAFFDPAKHLIDEAFELADGKEYFTLANVVNGAMLARLVSDAVLIAERRDRKSGQLSGVSEQDLLSALDTLYAEKRQLDHNDELKEFFVSLKDRLPSDNTQRQTMNS